MQWCLHCYGKCHAKQELDWFKASLNWNLLLLTLSLKKNKNLLNSVFYPKSAVKKVLRCFKISRDWRQYSPTYVWNHSPCKNSKSLDCRELSLIIHCKLSDHKTAFKAVTIKRTASQNGAAGFGLSHDERLMFVANSESRLLMITSLWLTYPQKQNPPCQLFLQESHWEKQLKYVTIASAKISGNWIEDKTSLQHALQ